ncbi:hypothetical protein [Sedimentitalea nanhaiensis]|uniref:Uncharacterized protein n=1 Tax=Sedimentitalea nanhaiensis TaxID=999627 RepID=A0A1I7ECQ7_9RHOB|nr:hypothetical protein [Sedimentitalea nanhaiensis]SFU21746.1 hypothetical protein SAMN05216236_1692 [Sedimentitalea nanhaiensis]
MSLIDITGTPILPRLAYLRSVFALARWKPEVKEDSKKRSRERLDFMLEMMKSHPEHFQSEQDFQNMMHFYPSRF